MRASLREQGKRSPCEPNSNLGEANPSRNNCPLTASERLSVNGPGTSDGRRARTTEVVMRHGSKTRSPVNAQLRTSIVRNFGLTMLAVFIACARPGVARSNGQPPLSALRTEIEAINRQMERAVARGDMLTVAGYYADDARLIGPRGQEVRGRTAIDAYWSGFRSAKAWKLEAFDIGGSTNEAYQFGRSTFVQTLPTGERSSVTDFVVIWRRGQDGRLRIALDFYH